MLSAFFVVVSLMSPSNKLESVLGVWTLYNTAQKGPKCKCPLIATKLSSLPRSFSELKISRRYCKCFKSRSGNYFAAALRW